MVKRRKIFISACEASADEHCGNLIKAVKNLDANVDFVGVGGEKMAQAGCEIIVNTVDKAAMTYQALGQLRFFHAVIKKIKSRFENDQFDEVVVCDSPAFNFHVAKAAKKYNFNTFFYVAPQLWAWAPWRIRKLRKCCDRLACILPFEKEWFSKRGIDCEFVGNPLLDETGIEIAENVKKYENYEPKCAKIAILPGSRDAEIETLWKPMQQIAAELKRVFTDIEVYSTTPSEEKAQKLKSFETEEIDINYFKGSVAELCKKVDLAIVASGSATLQIASAGCPMVVMYQTNKWLWHIIGRWLIRIKRLSLVNILANKELVPEFMPYFDSIDPIADVCSRILSDRDELRRISGEIIDIIRPLAVDNTSERVAKMLLEPK